MITIEDSTLRQQEELYVPEKSELWIIGQKKFSHCGRTKVT